MGSGSWRGNRFTLLEKVVKGNFVIIITYQPWVYGRLWRAPTILTYCRAALPRTGNSIQWTSREAERDIFGNCSNLALQNLIRLWLLLIEGCFIQQLIIRPNKKSDCEGSWELRTLMENHKHWLKFKPQHFKTVMLIKEASTNDYKPFLN